MKIDDLKSELNSYENGVVQKVQRTKNIELIKGVATSLVEFIFYNGTTANIRVTKADKVVSIEYLGRVILDYDEVSFNVKAKARQIIKMTLNSEKSGKVKISKFSEKNSTRIKELEDELKKELEELDAQIEAVKKELARYKEGVI